MAERVRVSDPSAEESGEAVHLPREHVEVGAGTITESVAPPSVGDAGLPHETLREIYADIALARALDERIWQLNRAGKAPFVVSGQGHEAAQVGVAFAMQRGVGRIEDERGPRTKQANRLTFWSHPRRIVIRDA